MRAPQEHPRSRAASTRGPGSAAIAVVALLWSRAAPRLAWTVQESSASSVASSSAPVSVPRKLAPTGCSNAALNFRPKFSSPAGVPMRQSSGKLGLGHRWRAECPAGGAACSRRPVPCPWRFRMPVRAPARVQDQRIQANSRLGRYSRRPCRHRRWTAGVPLGPRAAAVQARAKDK